MYRNYVDRCYAHIEIVTTFVVVDLLYFLIITRHHQVECRQNLRRILPTSLPDLSKPSRTSQTNRKHNFSEQHLLEQLKKHNDDFHLSVTVIWVCVVF